MELTKEHVIGHLKKLSQSPNLTSDRKAAFEVGAMYFEEPHLAFPNINDSEEKTIELVNQTVAEIMHPDKMTPDMKFENYLKNLGLDIKSLKQTK